MRCKYQTGRKNVRTRIRTRELFAEAKNALSYDLSFINIVDYQLTLSVIVSCLISQIRQQTKSYKIEFHNSLYIYI